jgi:hypothetical protein
LGEVIIDPLQMTSGKQMQEFAARENSPSFKKSKKCGILNRASSTENQNETETIAK